MNILFLFSVQEVFSWLLEASDDSSDLWDGGRITWSVRYANDIGSVGDETSPTEHSSDDTSGRRTRRHHFLARRDSGNRDYLDTPADEIESTKQSQVTDSNKDKTDNYEYSNEEVSESKKKAEEIHKNKNSKNKKYIQQKSSKEKHHESDKIELRYSSVDDEGHVVERKTILNTAEANEMESAKIDDEEILMEQYPTDEELNADDESEPNKEHYSTEKYLDRSSRGGESAEGSYMNIIHNMHLIKDLIFF